METQPKQIKIFQDDQGKEPFTEWVFSLSQQYRARIFARLDRVETGNLGDCQTVGDGVYELRCHFGAGYRIYFGELAQRIIILCGGDKRSQQTTIQQAKTYWKHYRQST